MISLKQNRGAYWNETAYWNKGASKEKNKFEGGRLLKRGRLLSTVLDILLFNRVSSRFVKSNCLEINSQCHSHGTLFTRLITAVFITFLLILRRPLLV